MFTILKIRIRQGYQAIKDIKKARISHPFRGFPRLDTEHCRQCGDCVRCCPAKAIHLNPFSLDLGRCVGCGDCQNACSQHCIQFTPFHKIASDTRDHLIVKPGQTEEDYEQSAFHCRTEIHRVFGRSLKLRQVSAGGCNGCEMELSACSNVNFDMGRFGIDVMASPRHADGILITGPFAQNMTQALEDAYQNTPEPRLVILAGSCAISGGLLAESPAINRVFIQKYPIDLYIPGCPVHPLTCINGFLALVNR